MKPGRCCGELRHGIRAPPYLPRHPCAHEQGGEREGCQGRPRTAPIEDLPGGLKAVRGRSETPRESTAGRAPLENPPNTGTEPGRGIVERPGLVQILEESTLAGDCFAARRAGAQMRFEGIQLRALQLSVKIPRNLQNYVLARLHTMTQLYAAARRRNSDRQAYPFLAVMLHSLQHANGRIIPVPQRKIFGRPA